MFQLHLSHNHILKYQKKLRLNTTHFCNMKLQQIALNHSSGHQDFIKIYKKRAAEPYSFLVDNTTKSDNPLRLRKKSFETYM